MRQKVLKDTQEVRTANRDPVDLRDQIYMPTLRPLRPVLSPESVVMDAIRRDEPLLWLPRDQGNEGTCTGQALATLIDLQQMLYAQDRSIPMRPASARMLYQMARQQESEHGPGSSLRAAIKAFYHHGVCRDETWNYVPNDVQGGLNVLRAKEARSMSLGAYYRLRPSLNDYHAALNEAGPLLVSAGTHSGWDGPNVTASKGRIVPVMDDRGGHAFVIIGYDDSGFLILNSWGPKWGGFERCQGVAHWSYQDWADNLFDGWVLRLGVPAPGAFDLTTGDQGLYFMRNAQRPVSTPGHEIIGHMVHLDDGLPVASGAYAYSSENLEETIRYLDRNGQTINRDQSYAKPWNPSQPPDQRGYRGVLLSLYGSLAGLKDAASQIAREKVLIKQHGLYPYTIVWCNDYVEKTTQVLNVLFEEAKKQVGDSGEELDRLIEEQVHGVGRAFWRDIERGSRNAATRNGAATEVLSRLSNLDGYDIHLITDGAGILLLRDLLRTMANDRTEIAEKILPKIASLDMITPVIDREEFESTFGNLVHFLSRRGQILAGGSRCALHVPSVKTEARLSVGLYSKSILQLIENAFCSRAGPLPNFIGKSVVKTGLRRLWARKPGFKAIDIHDITVATDHPAGLEQEHLRSRTRLLENIMKRVAPVPDGPATGLKEEKKRNGKHKAHIGGPQSKAGRSEFI